MVHQAQIPPPPIVLENLRVHSLQPVSAVLIDAHLIYSGPGTGG